MYLYRMNQSMFIALILIVACSMGEMFHGTQAQAAPLKKETQSRLVPDVDLGASVFGVVLGDCLVHRCGCGCEGARCHPRRGMAQCQCLGWI